MIQTKHLEMFRDCLYFSLAVDMAQFGQDHFLSCIGRFGFDDRISQVVLLFDKVAKTGDKGARFVFDRLNEKKMQFLKARLHHNRRGEKYDFPRPWNGQ